LLNKGTEVVEVLSTELGWQTEHPTGTSDEWEGRKIPDGFGSSAHGH